MGGHHEEGGRRGPAMAPPELKDNEDRTSSEASTMLNGAMPSVLMG
jgi:hypothetical protein